MQDEPTPEPHDPYDDFTVDEEPMPDGRTIRYYAWPPDIDVDAEAAEDHV